MGKDQKDIYEKLKKEMYAEYSGKELTVVNKMVMSIRLSMITGGLFPFSETQIKINADGEEYFDTHFEYKLIPDCGKIKTLLEDLEEVPEETFIIVWGRFRGEIELIEDTLKSNGYSCSKYYGGTDSSVIDQFKRKEFRILVASEKGGEGLNLQLSTLHYFYSNSFRADFRLQKEDRSHRIGQVNSVLYKDLLCKGTIDEHIYAALKRKVDLINYFREKSLDDILN
jgi:SNF2 family DNA or RNA helicase